MYVSHTHTSRIMLEKRGKIVSWAIFYRSNICSKIIATKLFNFSDKIRVLTNYVKIRTLKQRNLN